MMPLRVREEPPFGLYIINIRNRSTKVISSIYLVHGWQSIDPSLICFVYTYHQIRFVRSGIPCILSDQLVDALGILGIRDGAERMFLQMHAAFGVELSKDRIEVAFFIACLELRATWNQIKGSYGLL